MFTFGYANDYYCHLRKSLPTAQTLNRDGSLYQDIPHKLPHPPQFLDVQIVACVARVAATMREIPIIFFSANGWSIGSCPIVAADRSRLFFEPSGFQSWPGISALLRTVSVGPTE